MCNNTPLYLLTVEAVYPVLLKVLFTYYFTQYL